MIGDLIICIKIAFKRMFCMHDYRVILRKDLHGGDFLECRKCEKIKSNL